MRPKLSFTICKNSLIEQKAQKLPTQYDIWLIQSSKSQEQVMLEPIVIWTNATDTGKAREMLDESSAEGAAEHPPASVTVQEQWTQALCHPANLTKPRAHTLLSCMLSLQLHRFIFVNAQTFECGFFDGLVSHLKPLRSREPSPGMMLCGNVMRLPITIR